MNVKEYIKTHEQLKDLDFATVFMTIFILIEDKKLLWDFKED